jgi:hypothetical protein
MARPFQFVANILRMQRNVMRCTRDKHAARSEILEVEAEEVDFISDALRNKNNYRTTESSTYLNFPLSRPFYVLTQPRHHFEEGLTQLESPVICEMVHSQSSLLI